MTLSWPTPVLPRAAVYFCLGLFAAIHGADANVGLYEPNVVKAVFECVA